MLGDPFCAGNSSVSIEEDTGIKLPSLSNTRNKDKYKNSPYASEVSREIRLLNRPATTVKKEEKCKTQAKSYTAGTAKRKKTEVKTITEFKLQSPPNIISRKIIDVKNVKSRKKKKQVSDSLAGIIGKHREHKLDLLLMNKSSNDFNSFVQEYIRRQGLPENSKIFLINGPFGYIRRSLVSRGWIENKYLNSQAFHLK